MLCSQFALLFGLMPTPHLSAWLSPWVYLHRLPDVNLWAVAVGAVTIFSPWLAKKWAFFRCVPPLVVAMFTGAFVSWALDLIIGPDVVRLDRIGYLNLQWHTGVFPEFEVSELYVIKQLVLSAIGIAIVGGLQSVIILQSIKPNCSSTDLRRELLAQSGSNLTAGYCGGFACSGSFNRTSAHIQAGAQTRFSACCRSCFLRGSRYSRRRCWHKFR